jgi:hypothetical protein
MVMIDAIALKARDAASDFNQPLGTETIRRRHFGQRRELRRAADRLPN